MKLKHSFIFCLLLSFSSCSVFEKVALKRVGKVMVKASDEMETEGATNGCKIVTVP